MPAEAIFEVIVERAEAGADVPWRAEAEAMPLGLFSHVARDVELVVRDVAADLLEPECPLAVELLRASPM